MFELCEETAIVLYPWIFIDEEGFQKDKDTCPAYTELVREIFPQRFDILEQTRLQLDEGQIEKMLVESDIEITDDLIAGPIISCKLIRKYLLRILQAGNSPKVVNFSIIRLNRR